MPLPAPFRPAVPGDAPEVARLKNMAGRGLPLHIWTNLAPGDPWAHGAIGQEKAIAAGQVTVAGETGAVRGLLLGYRVPEKPLRLEDLPPLYRPVVALRSEARGSWYIDAVAAMPEARGQGLGHRMLALAEDYARGVGLSEMSLIVADDNHDARRLYLSVGYHAAKEIGFDPLDWDGGTRGWVLMRKPLA